MLNHDRVAVGNVDDECRRSKKAVFTAPSIPMLIWQARTRASAMAEGRDAGSATVGGLGVRSSRVVLSIRSQSSE